MSFRNIPSSHLTNCTFTNLLYDTVDRHDFFPKTFVGGGWVGDRYPLCVVSAGYLHAIMRHSSSAYTHSSCYFKDLPKHHFLSMGATFRFRAGSSLPISSAMPDHWDSDESIKRFVLSPGSALYNKLCNPGTDGSCNFVNTVKLDSNLPCYDRECRVDDVIIVQVTAGHFYEYIRQPCVDMSFYPDPKKVVTGLYYILFYAANLC